MKPEGRFVPLCAPAFGRGLRPGADKSKRADQRRAGERPVVQQDPSVVAEHHFCSGVARGRGRAQGSGEGRRPGPAAVGRARALDQAARGGARW